VSGVPPFIAEPKKDEDKRRLSCPGEEVALPLAFLIVDVTFFDSPNADLNAHDEGVPASAWGEERLNTKCRIGVHV